MLLIVVVPPQYVTKNCCTLLLRVNVFVVIDIYSTHTPTDNYPHFYPDHRLAIRDHKYFTPGVVISYFGNTLPLLMLNSGLGYHVLLLF